MNSKNSKLIVGYKKAVGRNNQGKITSRHRGGGRKKKIRFLHGSFFYEDNMLIKRIESDPNRAADLLLLESEKKRTLCFVLAFKGAQVGRFVRNFYSEKVFLQETLPGSVGCMGNLPVGTNIYSIGSLDSNKSNCYAKAAGCYGQILQKNSSCVTVRLPSGCIKRFSLNSTAFIGQVGNEKAHLAKLGKAGESRWRGIRPRVRGVAMNPVDHPHGGGEGKSSGGRPSVSPWGKLSKGKKTKR